MIRFIIHTESSKTDIYGNRYHSSTVTSTKSGNTLTVYNAGGDSNVAHRLRELGLEWSELRCTNATLPIRQYNRLYGKGAFYEHHLTAEHLAQLEA